MNQRQQVSYIFDKHADWYVQRFMDVSLYAASFDQFLELLPESPAQVVDLGCGPGNVTHYLLGNRPDLNITGVDLAPAMIEIAQKLNPSAHFRVSDSLSVLEQTTGLHGVVAGFLLPYLSEDEVVCLFSSASKNLIHGGVIYVSTMEDEYANSGLKTNSSGDQVNMYYYTEKQLESLLKNAGFTVKWTDRKTYVYNESEVTDLLLVAVKTEE